MAGEPANLAPDEYDQTASHLPAEARSLALAHPRYVALIDRALQPHPTRLAKPPWAAGTHGRFVTGRSRPAAIQPGRYTPPSYALQCYHEGMRTSVIFDDELAAEARELGINVSEAAREGLRQAVRRRRAERDRAAYLALPEREDGDWDDAEAWGQP